jgi:transposase
MKTYPSDLTKRERKILICLLFKRGNPHRQKWKWKTILNALFYILRTGCQWRQLPANFPPWRTIYGYYRRFCELGLWERLNTELRIRLRLLDGRKAQPTAVVFDTQSVKTTPVGGERGFDGYKRSMEENDSYWLTRLDCYCWSRSYLRTWLKRKRQWPVLRRLMKCSVWSRWHGLIKALVVSRSALG